jgi:hypothetical protein
LAIACPICGTQKLERISEEILVRATQEGESKIGGLIAYRCIERQHTFFVRSADVEAAGGI